MTEHSPEAHRRAVPRQSRAAATYQKILDTAAAILVDRGLQGLNTNLVAEQAGVNVATVYHYFADKNAILRELYVADQAIRNAYTAERFDLLTDADDVAKWFADGIRVLMRLRRATDVSTTLRRACRATPELFDLERQDSAAIAERLAPALRQRFPRLSPSRARTVASSIVETTAIMLDHASFDPAAEAGILRELTAMMGSYLESLDRAYGPTPTETPTERTTPRKAERTAPTGLARKPRSGGRR